MNEVPLKLELTETEELKKAVATELTFQVDTASIEEILKEQHGTSNTVDNRENS